MKTRKKSARLGEKFVLNVIKIITLRNFALDPLSKGHSRLTRKNQKVDPIPDLIL
jgi:hypothetical protein